MSSYICKKIETIGKYADWISSILNNIRLFGNDFLNKRIVEKVLVILPKRFKSKISSLEESKDLDTISLESWLVQFKHKNKEDLWDRKRSLKSFLCQNDKILVKENINLTRRIRLRMIVTKSHFHLARTTKKTTHMEKYYWWRPDAVCDDCKQQRYISNVCKSKIKTSKQA